MSNEVSEEFYKMIIDDMIKDGILVKETFITFTGKDGMGINSAFEQPFLELLRSNYKSIGEPREAIAITIMGYCPSLSVISKATVSDIVWNILNRVPTGEADKEKALFEQHMRDEIAKRKAK